jgi:hypothetical protein
VCCSCVVLVVVTSAIRRFPGLLKFSADVCPITATALSSRHRIERRMGEKRKGEEKEVEGKGEENSKECSLRVVRDDLFLWIRPFAVDRFGSVTSSLLPHPASFAAAVCRRRLSVSPVF